MNMCNRVLGFVFAWVSFVRSVPVSLGPVRVGLSETKVETYEKCSILLNATVSYRVAVQDVSRDGSGSIFVVDHRLYANGKEFANHVTLETKKNSIVKVNKNLLEDFDLEAIKVKTPAVFSVVVDVSSITYGIKHLVTRRRIFFVPRKLYKCSMKDHCLYPSGPISSRPNVNVTNHQITRASRDSVFKMSAVLLLSNPLKERMLVKLWSSMRDNFGNRSYLKVQTISVRGVCTRRVRVNLTMKAVTLPGVRRKRQVVGNLMYCYSAAGCRVSVTRLVV